jgi:hypothetical protein
MAEPHLNCPLCVRPPPTPSAPPPLQVPAFLGAGARHFVFMLKGLRELQPKLEEHGIPFFLLKVGATL